MGTIKKQRCFLPLSLLLTDFITWYSILHTNPQSTENTRFLRYADTAFYTQLKIQIPPSAPTTQSLWLRGFLYVSTFSAVLGGKNIFHYDNKKLKKRHFIFDFTNGNPSLQKRGVFFCFIQFQGLSPPSPNIPRSIPVPPRQYLSRSSPHRPAPTVPRHSHASTPEKHPSAASPLIDFCMRPDRIIR